MHFTIFTSYKNNFKENWAYGIDVGGRENKVSEIERKEDLVIGESIIPSPTA